MADEKRKKDDERGSGEFRFPQKTWIIWAFIAAGILLSILASDRFRGPVDRLSEAQFFAALEATNIVKATIAYSAEDGKWAIISGKYRKEEKDGKAVEAIFTTDKIKVVEGMISEDRRARLGNTAIFESKQGNALIMSLVFNIGLFVVLGALIYFFFIRQIKIAGKGAMSFGRSKARLLTKERNKTTFKDVAGVDEAVEEVSELVEFLKDPKKFQRLGGRIPKGVLMVGPPGTGKTLLAKAIAGEADASFFSISGSDFVEMFVGVGASRVRDMFDQARKNTPCLIFIDEIDAVGRSRGVGLGGGNDEREQTLNALLVEMDGFDTTDGIIIIAATNRPDVLDPALLRPGRFDRRITVNLPDVRGREAILKVHSRNVKLDPSVELSVIARGTPGYSGAELANLLNEGALLAARMGHKAVGMPELEEARDKVRWGRERRSLAMTDEQKRLTAWHEAGHALVNVKLEHTPPLHKVTIIPRGPSLGSTMSLPKEDVLSHNKRDLLDLITMTMAGRIAEEMVSGDISTGAGSDIQQATNIARAMVTQYGMSDRLGMVQYTEDDEYFIGRDMLRRTNYSEATAQQIDEEVKAIINGCFERAKQIIVTHRDKLEMIAKALLEYETLEGRQVEEIVRTGTFTAPLRPPKDPGPMLGAPAGTPLPEAPAKSAPPSLPGLGTPAPATA